MDYEIVVPQRTDLSSEGSSALVQARAITIQTEQHRMLASDFLGSIKGLRKKIDEAYDGIVASIYKSHRLAVATKKQYSDPVDEAERIVKRKLADYQEQRETEARRDQMVAEVAARKSAEDAQLAQAAALEAAGHKDAAEAVLNAPPAPAAVVQIDSGLSKIDGMSSRKLYSCRVTDLHKLAVFAVANPAILASCLLPNEKALDAMARAQKDSFCIPGCEAVVETIIARRAS